MCRYHRAVPLALLPTPLLLALLLAGCSSPPGPARPEVFTDVEGQAYSLPGPGECKAVALLFASLDCPTSNGYAAEVKRLWQEYQPRGVAFCLVYTDRDRSAEVVRRHYQEHGYPCLAILDRELRLARRVGATTVPEAAVLSPEGALLYLGRIDDRYVDFGKRRSAPTRRELRDALEAVLAGRPVAEPHTPTVGWPIDFPEGDHS